MSTAVLSSPHTLASLHMSAYPHTTSDTGVGCAGGLATPAESRFRTPTRCELEAMKDGGPRSPSPAKQSAQYILQKACLGYAGLHQESCREIELPDHAKFVNAVSLAPETTDHLTEEDYDRDFLFILLQDPKIGSRVSKLIMQLSYISDDPKLKSVNILTLKLACSPERDVIPSFGIKQISKVMAKYFCMYGCSEALNTIYQLNTTLCVEELFSILYSGQDNATSSAFNLLCCIANSGFPLAKEKLFKYIQEQPDQALINLVPREHVREVMHEIMTGKGDDALHGVLNVIRAKYRVHKSGSSITFTWLAASAKSVKLVSETFTDKNFSS